MGTVNRLVEMGFRKQKGDFRGCMSVCQEVGGNTECHNFCKNKAPLSEETVRKLKGLPEKVWTAKDYWETKTAAGDVPTQAQIDAHMPAVERNIKAPTRTESSGLLLLVLGFVVAAWWLLMGKIRKG